LYTFPWEGFYKPLKKKENIMEINKLAKKEEKQEDIIIIDEGFNSRDLIEPMGWRCCWIMVIPFSVV
jgi:hypothetical protein